MKLLFLAFAVISFLAQTTKGGWGEKKCFNKVGTCRAKCKTNESEHSTCDNKKKCCVPTDKMPTEAPGTGTSKVAPTSPAQGGALTHAAVTTGSVTTASKAPTTTAAAAPA